MTVSNLAEPARGSAGPLYFGWRIVAAMFLVTTMVIGNTLYAFIILAAPMAERFGWSAVQTGSLVSALWVAAPLALFVAPVIKRVGAIRILFFGLILQAVALAAVSQITEFWHLYLLRLAMGVGKAATLVAVPVMISRWFAMRFSTAMALAWCGGSFGGLVMSPLAEALTARFGWDGAAIAFGAIHAVSAVVMLLLCRGPAGPADIGQAMDGRPLAATEPGLAAIPAAAPEILGGRDVLRSIRPSTALLMALAVMLTGTGAISMLSRMPALFEAGGLSPSAAATLFGLMAGASALGQPIIGWFLDRSRVPPANLFVAFMLFGGAAGFAALQLHQSPLLLASLAAICWGFGMGANEMIWITLTKRQFGTAMFAYTYGAWSCALQAGYAMGGPIGGWASDNSSAFSFPLLIALFYLPSIVIAVWRPGRRNEE